MLHGLVVFTILQERQGNQGDPRVHVHGGVLAHDRQRMGRPKGIPGAGEGHQGRQGRHTQDLRHILPAKQGIHEPREVLLRHRGIQEVHLQGTKVARRGIQGRKDSYAHWGRKGQVQGTQVPDGGDEKEVRMGRHIRPLHQTEAVARRMENSLDGSVRHASGQKVHRRLTGCWVDPHTRAWEGLRADVHRHWECQAACSLLMCCSRMQPLQKWVVLLHRRIVHQVLSLVVRSHQNYPSRSLVLQTFLVPHHIQGGSARILESCVACYGLGRHQRILQ